MKVTYLVLITALLPVFISNLSAKDIDATPLLNIDHLDFGMKMIRCIKLCPFIPIGGKRLLPAEWHLLSDSFQSINSISNLTIWQESIIIWQ